MLFISIIKPWKSGKCKICMLHSARWSSPATQSPTNPLITLEPSVQLLLIMRPVLIPDMSSYKESTPVNTSNPHKNARNPNEYPDLTLSSISVNSLKFCAININF